VEEERLVDTGARRAQGGTFIHLVSARGGNWRTAAAVDGMEDGSGRRRHGGRQRPSTAWRTAAAVDGMEDGSGRRRHGGRQRPSTAQHRKGRMLQQDQHRKGTKLLSNIAATQ